MPEPLERAPLEKDAFRVEPAEAGERLDAFLARRAAHLSRSRHKALIKDGKVRIAGAPSLDPNRRLEPGDLICTGTPEGVALSGRFPYLAVGDVVELEVQGLGRQRQRLVRS